MASTASVISWDQLFRAYRDQSSQTAKQCSSLLKEYRENENLLADRHEQNAPIGFTDSQFLSAIKTCEVALQLFTEDLSKEQLECVQNTIECARISAKLMWEDRVKAGTEITSDIFDSLNNKTNIVLRLVRTALEKF